MLCSALWNLGLHYSVLVDNRQAVLCVHGSWQKRRRVLRLSRQSKAPRTPSIQSSSSSIHCRTPGHCGTLRTINATTGSTIRKSLLHSAQSRIFGRKWRFVMKLCVLIDLIVSLTSIIHYFFSVCSLDIKLKSVINTGIRIPTLINTVTFI